MSEARSKRGGSGGRSAPGPATELVWAQDEFLAAEFVDRFCARASADDEVLTLTCDGDVPGLDQALFASSLFATKRFVVIGKAEQLRKAGVERLTQALGDPAMGAEVVVSAVSDYEPRQLTKGLSDVATVHRLTRPRRGELVAWVAKRMRSAGLGPDRQAPAVLVEAVGEGLRDLAQATDQLALRLGKGGTVTEAVVREQFAVVAEQPIWMLFDAIVRHEGPKAFDTLRRLSRAGDEPLAILFAIVSQVRYLMRAKSLIERNPGTTDGDIARELGVSAGRAAVLRRQASRLSWEWLLGVHRLLGDADFELKGGEDGAVLPAEAVLERVVAGALDA